MARALDMGADDYLAGLSVDYAQRRVVVAGEPVKLTATACCCNQSGVRSGWARPGWCGRW